jgi:hypothetical protein
MSSFEPDEHVVTLVDVRTRRHGGGETTHGAGAHVRVVRSLAGGRAVVRFWLGDETILPHAALRSLADHLASLPRDLEGWPYCWPAAGPRHGPPTPWRLTPCCGTGASVDEHGTYYCKVCFEPVDPWVDSPPVLSEADRALRTTVPPRPIVISGEQLRRAAEQQP